MATDLDYVIDAQLPFKQNDKPGKKSFTRLCAAKPAAIPATPAAVSKGAMDTPMIESNVTPATDHITMRPNIRPVLYAVATLLTESGSLRLLVIFCSMRRIRRESRAAANEARNTTNTIRTASSSTDEETERVRNSNLSITFAT